MMCLSLKEIRARRTPRSAEEALLTADVATSAAVSEITESENNFERIALEEGTSIASEAPIGQALASPHAGGHLSRISSGQPMGPAGNWRLLPQFTDTFSGNALDETKWLPTDPTWKGRAPGWFNPENVVVKNGVLELWSRVEDPPAGYDPKFNTFSTSFVRSKGMIGYGFVQAVVQVADSITSSAFWMVHNQTKTWNEIDVFEASTADGQRGEYHMNMHVFRTRGKTLQRTRSKPKTSSVGFDMSKRPFVAGIEKTKEAVRWYVDGQLIREERNTSWHKPMWVQFDCETMGNWFGVPDINDSRLPAVFRVFEVRSWTRDD